MNINDIWHNFIYAFTLLVLALVLIALFGCKSTERTTDVQYIMKIQHDSIFLHDSIVSNYAFGKEYFADTITNTVWRVDTVFKTRIRTAYKDRLLIDTMYINVEREKIVTQPVAEVLSGWKQAVRWAERAALVALLIIILVFVIKKFNVIRKLFSSG